MTVYELKASLFGVEEHLDVIAIDDIEHAIVETDFDIDRVRILQYVASREYCVCLMLHVRPLESNIVNTREVPE